MFWESHKDVKPCPFCGENLPVLHRAYNRHNYYFIRCDVCGASSKSSNDPETTFARWQMRNGR
ncbi:MAG: Lar family restriction alleviation protein [Oscillospiraceae bacterium]